MMPELGMLLIDSLIAIVVTPEAIDPFNVNKMVAIKPRLAQTFVVAVLGKSNYRSYSIPSTQTLKSFPLANAKLVDAILVSNPLLTISNG